MSVWLVRAGRFGENEAKALDEGIVTIGWNSMPDLAKVASREELTALYESLYPDASKGRVANQVGQIWAFTSRINQGDLVVLPLKTQSSIAIGKIAGNYTYTTAMGFGSPRLCVQVKSGQSPADVTVLRELQGILQGYQAQQGLLVSWGGFKKSVLNEAKQSFCTIRLWDSGDLFKAIVRNYDRLPDELQAELPLKRCWALVLEE